MQRTCKMRPADQPPGPTGLEIRNHLDGDHQQEFKADVRAGLTCRQKVIPSKYFYDARGSELFERICCTPEYYPTDTEISILKRRGREIMDFFSGSGGDLVELGSGSNRKVQQLLDEAPLPEGLNRIRYVPVDISEECLVAAARELTDLYPDLRVLGIVGDFTRHIEVLPEGKKLIAFLGSTIGNFSPEEGISVLRRIGSVMRPGDRLVVGIDMLKPRAVLEAAYNDEQGITRQFNLNVLARINRELGADFDLNDFEHVAFFNSEMHRIEMHLRALRDVTVWIEALSLPVSLDEGETIHTESSHKYSRERARAYFQTAGLDPVNWFSDPKGWFSLVLLEASCWEGEAWSGSGQSLTENRRGA